LRSFEILNGLQEECKRRCPGTVDCSKPPLRPTRTPRHLRTVEWCRQSHRCLNNNPVTGVFVALLVTHFVNQTGFPSGITVRSQEIAAVVAATGFPDASSVANSSPTDFPTLETRHCRFAYATLHTKRVQPAARSFCTAAEYHAFTDQAPLVRPRAAVTIDPAVAALSNLVP